MSTPAPVTVTGVATLAVSSQPLPSSNAAQASNSVVVTDSAGTVYPAVVLTGAESTPWSWAATYASGSATAVVTALDVNGATIGTVLSTSFNVVAVVAATFEAPSGITFVANATSPATAAVHAALKRG
jgi:hypothetical protein